MSCSTHGCILGHLHLPKRHLAQLNFDESVVHNVVTSDPVTPYIRVLSPKRTFFNIPASLLLNTLLVAYFQYEYVEWPRPQLFAAAQVYPLNIHLQYFAPEGAPPPARR